MSTALLDNFELLAGSQGGVAKLRELILSLAVRGKLVPQDPSDEPASELLKRIRAEKDRLINEGKIKRDKPLAAISEDETPYELPAGWAWSSLAQIGLISPRNEAADDLAASFVQMSSIPARFGEAHLVEQRAWRDIKSGFTHFAENDVGVAKITPCFENGKSTVFRGLTNGIGAGTTELHVVRPIGGTLPDYILLFLKTPDFLVAGERVMTGSAGQKRLPRQYFEASPFPLPPLPEQSRIVAKVEELMALCDRLEAEQGHAARVQGHWMEAALEQLAESADADAFRRHWQHLAEHFDTLFTTPESIDRLDATVLQLAVRGKLVPQDPSDQPASELLKQIRTEKDRLIVEGKIKRDKPLPPITDEEKPYALPEGWEWVRLRAVGESFDYGTSQKTSEIPRGTAVLRMGNIQDGQILLTNLKYFEDSAGELPNLYLRSGDLLFNRTNSYELVGKTGLFHGPDESFSYASYIIRIRVVRHLFSPPFLNAYMNCATCRTTQIEPEIVQQNGQANFNGTKLQSILVPVPPLPEQSRIVAQLDKLLALTAELKTRLIAARTKQAHLRDALIAEVC